MPLGPKLMEAKRLRAAGAPGDLRFILVGAFGALVVGLVTTFGPHSASAFSIERRLGQTVSAELNRAGYIGVRVTMDGQTAILDGVVSTPQQAAKAGAVALHAVGRGGWWSGGVVKVINHIASASARLERSGLSARGEEGPAAPKKMKFSAAEGAGAKLAGAVLARRAGAGSYMMIQTMRDFGTDSSATAAGGGASWRI